MTDFQMFNCHWVNSLFVDNYLHGMSSAQMG